MTWLEAFILGIIQGLTEFLPVSSSGHLEIGNVLLGVKDSDNLLFAIVVHGATALSTIVVFRKEILDIFEGVLQFRWNESWIYSIKIFISLLPVMVVGLLFKDTIESFFTGNLLLVGSMLIVTALLLLFSSFKKSHDGEVGHVGALIMGLAQAVAILPGISRSGATIATGLLLGFDKAKVTQFSFLMVLIPIIGASLLQLKDYLELPTGAGSIEGSVLAIGFLSAFISGYVACKWMLAIVRKGKLIYFAGYCALAGIVAIIFA